MWNCNSLNFKKQHAILKTSFNHKSDIFLLPEIKNPLNTSFTGYNSIYKHRATLGGGLAILVNTKFSLKRRHDLELSPQNEIIWVDISGHGVNNLLCVAYRCPSLSSFDYHILLDSISLGIQTSIIEGKPAIVTGDFNSHHLSWDSIYLPNTWGHKLHS